MPHERFNKWYKGIRNYDFVMGECNCAECAPQINLRKYVEDALEDMYGYSDIPRMYDPDFNFLRRDVEARHYAKVPHKMWRSILASVCYRNDRNLVIDEFKGVCRDCGVVASKHNLVEVEPGVKVCGNCRDRFYVKCIICNKWRWHSGHLLDIRTGGKICKPCTDHAESNCLCCGTPIFDRDDEYNINHLVHEDDYEIEVGIGEAHYNFKTGWEFEDYKTVFRPGAVLCPKCKESQIVKCDDCGDQAYKPHMHAILDGQGGRKKLCFFCHERLNVVKRYDYAVRPQWLTSVYEPTRVKDGLFLGVEIEVEYPGEWHTTPEGVEYRERMFTKEQQGRKALDWWGGNDLYIKHDGTLDYGFEIVSHPFTWGHYLDNHEKWGDFLEYLRELGFQSTYFSKEKNKYTCGFHVHMSKNAFTRMHLFKFVKFFYKASTRSLVTSIAGRDGSQYAKFEHKDYKEAVKIGRDKYNMSQRRFSAINLMGGHAHKHGHAPAECQTAEVRIFQGSLEPFMFHRNLEFLVSLYEFTMESSPKELMVRNYVNYLMGKPDKWRCLLNYIKYDPKINKAYAYIANMVKGV